MAASRSNKIMVTAASESEGTINIPDDVVIDILYRVPVKYIGRFRCVSKYWQSLLSSPEFIKTHQNKIKNDLIIFVSYCDFSLYSLPVNHHESVLTPTKFQCNFKNFKLHGSCNGLVLASSHYIDDEFNVINKCIVLNPTTREFREIPELPESSYGVTSNLTKTDTVYGFGYDSVTDDYKVVAISYFRNIFDLTIPANTIGRVHVYSLRTNTWKRVTDSPHNNSCIKRLPGVFINGFLHWFAMNDFGRSPVIVAFSLADEKFSQVPPPNLPKKGCKLVDLGSGKLGVFVKSKLEFYTFVTWKGEVWLMKEYGIKESWTKILLQGVDNFSITSRPTFFYDNGKIMLISDNQMLIYDTEERCFSKNVLISRKQFELKEVMLKASSPQNSPRCNKYLILTHIFLRHYQ